MYEQFRVSQRFDSLWDLSNSHSSTAALGKQEKEKAVLQDERAKVDQGIPAVSPPRNFGGYFWKAKSKEGRSPVI